MVDVAKDAGLHDPVVGGLVHRVVIPLVSDLEHAVIAQRRRAHAFAALQVPRHHLLAQDVLAGVETTDGEIRVGPQRRRHDDGLDILLLQHLAPVCVMARRRHAVLGQHAIRELQLRRVDVAEGTHVAVVGIDVGQLRPPLRADADERESHPAARRRTAERGGRAERRHRRRARQHLQEVAAAQFHLFGCEIHATAS